MTTRSTKSPILLPTGKDDTESNDAQTISQVDRLLADEPWQKMVFASLYEIISFLNVKVVGNENCDLQGD